MSDTNKNEFPLANMEQFKETMSQKVKDIFLGFIDENQLDEYVEKAFLEFNENELSEMIKVRIRKLMVDHIDQELHIGYWNNETKALQTQYITKIISTVVKEDPTYFITSFMKTIMQPTIQNVMQETIQRTRNNNNY